MNLDHMNLSRFPVLPAPEVIGEGFEPGYHLRIVVGSPEEIHPEVLPGPVEVVQGPEVISGHQPTFHCILPELVRYWPPNATPTLFQFQEPVTVGPNDPEAEIPRLNVDPSLGFGYFVGKPMQAVDRRVIHYG
jgi:hypothetical protein